MQEGEAFLHKRTPGLHTSDPVEHEQDRRALAGEDVRIKPAEKISDWMEVLERTHTGHRDDPRVLDRIKKHYHDTYVITPDAVPQGYFDLQKRLARERGHGDVDITPELREQITDALIADQRSTLDLWVDYLASPDADSFPMWAKYWAFTGMVKLSSYDKEKHAFGARDKGTVAPFPDLDREALAVAVDAITKQAQKEQISLDLNNPVFRKILEGGNFGKLYAYAIEHVQPTEENTLENTAGEWITYPQGSDHMPLVRSLQGHATGWCTAGESTAEAQLKGGDFHVYYSLDKQGNPTIPRVAIRMEEESIGEVRGIAPDQNLDPYITSVVQEKLASFGSEGERYTKRSEDMARLTEVERRYQQGSELTPEDLRFLYEIDTPIEGFGYQKDPRIEEILKGRDVKSDLSLLLNIPADRISTTEQEADSGRSLYHYGDLNLEDIIRVGWLGPLPRTINGSLMLDNLPSAEGLILPNTVQRNLSLSSIKSSEGLKLPQTVGGDLYLDSLYNIPNFPEDGGLILPKTVGGYLGLYSLTSAEGVTFPQAVGGTLDLARLTSAEGLTLPQTVEGNLILTKLTSAEGLTLPQTVEGDLILTNLASIRGLVLPQKVGGNISLHGLNPAEKQQLCAQYPHLKIF